MKQRAFWKQYATDLYQIEKQRQWESDLASELLSTAGDLAVGIGLGLLGCGLVIIVCYYIV